MPFNIIRFFLDLMLESYLVSVLIFWLLSRYNDSFNVRKEGIWHNLNLIGLCLGILLFFDEASAFFEDPSGNNYKIHWQDQPYWYAFRVVFIIIFSLATLVLLSKKRRNSYPWNRVGVILFFSSMCLHPLESWMTSNYYGRSYPVSIDLMLFSAHVWWLGWILAALFFAAALYFASTKSVEH